MITDQTGSPRREGQLTRSIWLPTLASDYTPDGLTPGDIDALIAECGLDLTAVDELVEQTYRDTNPAPRPLIATWTSEDRRRRRREVRRKTRSLDTPTTPDGHNRELEALQTRVPADPATWSGYAKPGDAA